MAQYFWVGGTGTWDGTTNHFATSTGGTATVAAPTAADDVFFDGNSGTGTVTTAGTVTDNCRSLTFTNYTGTFTFGAGTVVNIGDAGGGDLLISSGMTLSTPGVNPNFNFVSTSGAVQKITTNGKTMPQLVVNTGSTTTMQFQDNVTLFAAAVLTHNGGIWDFNGKTVNAGIYTGGSSARTLTLGNSAVTLTTAAPWTTGTIGTLTMTSNTATITFSSSSAVLTSGTSFNFNGTNLVFSGTGTNKPSGTTTFAAGSISGTAAGSTLTFNAATAYTFTNMTFNGGIGNNITVNSDTAGTTTTLTVTGTTTLSNVTIKDIGNITNARVFNATNNCIDSGNNRGINFGVAFIAQSNSIGIASSTTGAVTFVKDTVTGNAIIVASYNASNTIASVTDSQNNGYTLIDKAISPNTEIWYASNAIGGTTPTVTVTYNGSAANRVVGVYELGGVSIFNPLDQHTVAVGNSTTSLSGNTNNTTITNEIVIGYVGSASATVPSAPITGYTNLVGRSNFGLAAKNITSIGIQSASFTVGSATWDCGVATFAGDNQPSNAFNAVQYGDISSDDGDYFIERGSRFITQKYKSKHPNNTDNISFVWKGRSTQDTRISPLVIQIYNVNVASWETLARINKVTADTDFQITVNQTTNLSNYYDYTNTVTFRSYQQVI